MTLCYIKRHAWRFLLFYSTATISSVFAFPVFGQRCPTQYVTALNDYPNTFFTASQTTVNAGSSSITLGPSLYGSSGINTGDILLIIQMQGAQINSSNSNNYGNGTGTGSGYLSNSNLMAGNMEFITAANNVPATGGTLNLLYPLTNSYKISAYNGTDGQYTYQVVKVPLYNNVQLNNSITAPPWSMNASGQYAGGMVILFANDSIILNSYTISAAGMGFRGGGGVMLNGPSSLSNTDYLTSSSVSVNGSKGEGIAGTPRFVAIGNTVYDSHVEGYPGGSFARGAPGNAGGGGTDGYPISNAMNCGGGGGANGGPAGLGGWAWRIALDCGGHPGSSFAEGSPSRILMGGGGGAGTTNGGTGVPAGGVASSGGAGGGIVILIANTISGPGTINVNGNDANGTLQNDGGGGGGAGGTAIIYSIAGNLTNITATANGGQGGTTEFGVLTNGAAHGPGGGGGGGVIYSNTPLNPASSSTGGAPGTTFGSDPNYGATAGSSGVLVQNISVGQMATTPPVGCTILSVNFLSLTARQNNGLLTLNWDVASESDIREYQVEKSLDGSKFSAIGSVSPKMSNGPVNHYDYPDNSSAADNGMIYYRIREIDGSGRSVYSKIISVRMNGPADKLYVFPNPAASSATVSFTSPSASKGTLKLFDMKGGQLWQYPYSVNAGQQFIQLDNIAQIPNGIYILQLSGGSDQQQVKLLVHH